MPHTGRSFRESWSLGSLEAGPPAKHLYGLRRAGQSPVPLHRRPQPACQPRDQTPRSGPETLFSTPTRDPFKLRTAAGSFLAERHGSSYLRTCVWGGCAKVFDSFSSDVVGEVNEPGAAASLKARAPGGRPPRRLDRWRPRPIKAPESSRAHRRPAGLWPHWVWSGTRRGIGWYYGSS